jgi:hypothetical protein
MRLGIIPKPLRVISDAILNHSRQIKPRVSSWLVIIEFVIMISYDMFTVTSIMMSIRMPEITK